MKEYFSGLALRRYKTYRERLQSQHNEAGEARAVVKGTSRRVVVVKPPNEQIFEQAIFIVRDEYLRSAPSESKKLLSEAQKAAAEYVSDRCPAKRHRHHPLYAAFGAGTAVVALFILHFVFRLF